MSVNISNYQNKAVDATSRTIGLSNLFMDEKRKDFLKLIAVTCDWVGRADFMSPLAKTVAKAVKPLASDVKNSITLLDMKGAFYKEWENFSKNKAADAFQKGCEIFNDSFDVLTMLASRSIVAITPLAMTNLASANAVILLAVSTQRVWKQMSKVATACSASSEDVRTLTNDKVKDLVGDATKPIEAKKVEGEIHGKAHLIARELLELAKQVSILALGAILTYGLLCCGAVDSFHILIASTVNIAATCFSFASSYWHSHPWNPANQSVQQISTQVQNLEEVSVR